MMDTNYAKEKLTLLLRDIEQYNACEFRRQMIKIVNGACGLDISDDCHLQAKKITELKAQFNAAAEQYANQLRQQVKAGE